jgi:hypothetical protein
MVTIIPERAMRNWPVMSGAVCAAGSGFAASSKIASAGQNRLPDIVNLRATKR